MSYYEEKTFDYRGRFNPGIRSRPIMDCVRIKFGVGFRLGRRENPPFSVHVGIWTRIRFIFW